VTVGTSARLPAAGGVVEDSGLPYVHLRLQDGQVTVRGSPSVSLGHRLPRGPGEKPDGVFATWSWDGRILRVENDRYGCYPLYYAAGRGEIYLSPSVLQLLRVGVSREVDETALGVFLRLGYFIGDETPFRAIRAVPPDATFVWRDGQLEVSGRYACSPEQTITRSAAIDAYVELFRQAIRRRPPTEEAVVTLSGGRDSRHILLELCAQGTPPRRCVTTYRSFPSMLGRYAPSEDVELARALSEAVGVEHVLVAQSPSALRAERRKNLLTGFCTDEHGWYLAVADYLEGRATAVYDGIAGDGLSEDPLLDPEGLRLYRQGRLGELADRWLDEREEALLRTLIPPMWAGAGDRGRVRTRLVAELRAFAGAPNPVGAFLFWSLTRRETALAPYGLLRGVDLVYSPYLDHDLYDFLTSLPGEMLLDHRFHTETIARAHPRYAAFPYPAKDAAVLRRPMRHRSFTLEALREALARPTAFRATLVPTLVAALARGAPRWVLPVVVYLMQLEEVCRDLPASAAAEEVGASSG
jgi:hypothetical protein